MPEGRARDDADQSEVFTALVALENLVRDAGHRSIDGGLVHDDRLGEVVPIDLLPHMS